MPKKIRELKAMLGRAGFSSHPARGSHVVWKHKKYRGIVTIAGKDASDAPEYMERQVERAIATVEERR
jgi:predicted RNA binding protein YcfA (HicA-like mRNA interferase family)